MKLRIICLGTTVFTALSLQVYAQNSTQPPSNNKSPQESFPNGAPIVALFEDNLPWGSGQNESILTTDGITFQVFPSSQMGTVDLTQFVKVVLVSQQPDLFYTRLEANDGVFEDYVNGGGILEMHLANGGGSQVERALLPFGLRVTQTFCSNTVSVVDPTDPLLNTPNAITEAQLQGWNCSAHGALIGVDALGLNVVVNNVDGPQGPASAEGPVGAGIVAVTYSPVEWPGTPNTRLYNENILCFALSGYGNCP
jgi:hypothetical protein